MKWLVGAVGLVVIVTWVFQILIYRRRIVDADLSDQPDADLARRQYRRLMLVAVAALVAAIVTLAVVMVVLP